MTKPGTTPTPNHILDNMHRMKPSVFAVVMAVVRKTCGYDDGTGTNTRVEWDEISTSQFIKLTGLSNRAVIDAIQKAITDGWIERKGKGNSFRYRLADYENSSQVIVNCEKSSQPIYENSSQINGEIYEKSSHTKESINNTPNGVSGEPTSPPDSPLAEQFHALNAKLRDTKNRGAVLREVYELCFGKNGVPSYSYLGKVANQVGGAGNLARLMFELIARPPAGDIMAYIIAEHRNKQNRSNGNGRDAPTAHSSWVELETGTPDYMEQ